MNIILRRIPRSRLAFFGIFGPTSADIVTTPGYEDLDKKYSGMEGLKRMFTPDDYGELSPELTTVIHMSSLSCFAGIVYGAISQGREAWVNFIENNQATQFVNHLDAKKKLQDQVTLAMGRGALKWGLRIGLFSSTFIILNTCIRVYRGEPGLMEYIGAGAITGGLFRMNLGPKGVVAGSIIGTSVGTLAGAASQSLLYISGYTMADIEKTQHELQSKRNELISKAMEAQSQSEYKNIRITADKKVEKENKMLPLDTVLELEEK